MTKITIYHNPRCSKSRQTLALLEEHGVTPDIIEYLKTPPSQQELKNILSLLKLSPRDLLRSNEADFKENNLGDTHLTDAALIKAMTQFPKLIQRPIVIHGKKAVLGRPPENVLNILTDIQTSKEGSKK